MDQAADGPCTAILAVVLVDGRKESCLAPVFWRFSRCRLVLLRLLESIIVADPSGCRGISSRSSRASSFVWPLASSFRRNEKPEGTISAVPGVSNIENPQRDGTEVNLPTVVINFLETDAL